MTIRTHLVMGFVVVLGVVAASCADPSSEPGGVPSEYQTVDEFMGRGAADAEAQYRAFTDLQGRIEGLLVECMADRGLEYAPYEGPTGERPPLGEGLSNSEFKLEYGYGVFTGMLEQAHWNTADEEYEGLEPDEWYWAFADDPDYMAVLDECTIQIEEELGRPDPGFHETMMATLDEAWGSLDSELDEMPQRIEKDSRYREAERAWSACMADNGHDFANEGDIDGYLAAKLEEFEATVNLGTVVLTESFEKDIRPLIDEELAIAAVDLECRTELDAVHHELRREYEGLFIDEHRDQLEEVRQYEQQLTEVLMEGWQW
jgi:hypothetical protein